MPDVRHQVTTSFFTDDSQILTILTCVIDNFTNGIILKLLEKISLAMKLLPCHFV
jgi:hypothetical protein